MLFKKMLLVLILLTSGIVKPVGFSIASINNKEQRWSDMAAQVDSWTDGLGLGIDSNIKETVIVLNLLGFTTRQSCEGHLDWGSPYPWVDFSLDDADIDSVQHKLEEVLGKINDLDPEGKVATPELIAWWKQRNELRDQIDRLRCEKIIGLRDLVSKFYENRPVDYDCILVCGSCWPRLQSIGGDWQIVRDEDNKLKKLQEYQQEMRLFTEFLKEYYWSD